MLIRIFHSLGRWVIDKVLFVLIMIYGLRMLSFKGAIYRLRIGKFKSIDRHNAQLRISFKFSENCYINVLLNGWQDVCLLASSLCRENTVHDLNDWVYWWHLKQLYLNISIIHACIEDKVGTCRIFPRLFDHLHVVRCSKISHSSWKIVKRILHVDLAVTKMKHSQCMEVGQRNLELLGTL